MIRLLIIFLCCATVSFAQNTAYDLQLLGKQQHEVGAFGKVKKKRSFKPLSLLYAGTLGFYQSQISPQWGANCAFELTCSRFSAEMIKEYGLAKGFFMTFDRLGRCNKLSIYETLPLRINPQGKIIDPLAFYKIRE